MMQNCNIAGVSWQHPQGRGPGRPDTRSGPGPSPRIGAPDEKWGERVVAFVVPRPDTSVDVSDLVSHCRGLIAGYKVPKEIHLVGTLPQTASGKVQKAALRKQLEGMP
jgi:acyl-CoA synthetase (AMP-forming)/AMP-acid ligase II